MEISRPLMREVVKKATGIFLFCVMTLVVAMEVPALKYCLCMDSFLVGGCVCESEQVIEAFEPVSACASCCATRSENTPVKSICETPAETHQCMLTFTMDLGDYHNESQFELTRIILDDTFERVDIVAVDTFEMKLASLARGSSEPPPIPSPEPLYRRHSVYSL